MITARSCIEGKSQISYRDHARHSVTLKLSKGTLELSLLPSGDGDVLTLAGITKQERLEREGQSNAAQTKLASLVTPAGVHFKSTLASPAFAIGPLRASVVDELLAPWAGRWCASWSMAKPLLHASGRGKHLSGSGSSARRKRVNYECEAIAVSSP